MRWSRRPENRERILAKEKEWKQSHPEQYQAINRRYYLKKYFGITPEEWQVKFESQGRRCAICGCTEPRGGRWALDHSHVTGILRAILCMLCNTVLGKMEDNPELLRRAAKYLEEYGTQNPNSSGNLPQV